LGVVGTIGGESGDHGRSTAHLTESARYRALAREIAHLPRVAVIGADRVAQAMVEALEVLLGRVPGRRPVVTLGPDLGAAAVVIVDDEFRAGLYTRSGGVDVRALGVESPIEVAILGPTEIRGVETSLRTRPLLTELVVFLALHPSGALTRTWSSALWPDRLVPTQTISNRLSEARQLLGLGPDDLPRLRRDGDRHRLADVTTDWSRFRRLADSDDPESWRGALELVRGRPLADLGQGQWTVMEGFVTEIEQSVVECGLALGRALLRTGEPDGAQWAAQMALRCAPWDERLHRILMRAADACGNRQGIESALQHLALVLEIDGDPLHGVHPQTAALYARLTDAAVSGAPG
jgi:hypothetical protein